MIVIFKGEQSKRRFAIEADSIFEKDAESGEPFLVVSYEGTERYFKIKSSDASGSTYEDIVSQIFNSIEKKEVINLSSCATLIRTWHRKTLSHE